MEDQIIEFTVHAKPVYMLSFDTNGGSLDGQSGIVTLQYEEGTVITMPEPVREGYRFRYWKGSKYEAGEKYTVSENHTFTAQWKKDSKSDDSKDEDDGEDTGSGSGSGAGTGDSARLVGWAALFAAAMLGLVVALIHKRHN